jgi:catechol 2,3-dioxygenase-like lactoylglutathione lyase family enzyme
MMQVREILETCLYVDDLDQAETFYGSVLGLTLISRQANRHVFFRCGNRMLLVFNPDESSRPDSELPPHGMRGSGHVAFAVAERTLDQWRRRLKDVGVEIEQVVDWPQGGRSFYFRDPAGNSLELATPRIWGISESEVGKL